MIKLFLISLFFSLTLSAQMPDTDIWLFKIEKKEGKYNYANPFNITNTPGYDNQPVFSKDNKVVYYVTIKETNQVEIYSYHIGNKAKIRITHTPESEYSPTLNSENDLMSCVVVLLDSSQQIYNYDLSGKVAPSPLSKGNSNPDSVGYFTFLNRDTVLYYKLTEPHSLRAWDMISNKDVWICNHPTRSIKKIGSSSKFMYGIKDSVSTQFRIYNPSLRESSLYATYPSLNEDFIWHHELGLIKSEGADLLRYNESTKNWEVLFSFSSLGIKKITRFVFDSKTKQLAIVSNL
jgi:hypothetical protein